MNNSNAQLYENTELTFRSALSKWGRWFLAYSAWAFAGMALISALITIPRLLGRFEAEIQRRETRLRLYSSEVRTLLNEMHSTLQSSEAQSDRFLALQAGLDAAPEKTSASPLGAAPVTGKKYAVDPVTGVAIIDYSQIHRR